MCSFEARLAPRRTSASYVFWGADQASREGHSLPQVQCRSVCRRLDRPRARGYLVDFSKLCDELTSIFRIFRIFPIPKGSETPSEKAATDDTRIPFRTQRSTHTLLARQAPSHLLSRLFHRELRHKHLIHSGLRHVEESERAHRDQGIEVCGREFREWLGVKDPGVIHYNGDGCRNV